MTTGKQNVIAVAGFALAIATAATARHRGPMLVAANQCSADTDCKGDRICASGKCVDPQALKPALPAPLRASVPTPGPGAASMPKDQLMVCSDDEDCGAGKACRKGDCISLPPKVATPRPAPPAATPAAAVPAVATGAPVVPVPAVALQAGRCVNDVDCTGDAVCNHGSCIFPATQALAVSSPGSGKFKTPNVLSVRHHGGAK